MATVKHAITGTAMNYSASTWGQIVAGGVVTHPVVNAVLTPAVSPGWTVDALIGLYVEINLIAYQIADNDASSLTLGVVGPVDGTYRWMVFNEAAPSNGEEANLNAATVVMDIATVPATGTLAALCSKTSAAVPAGSAGQLTVAMDVLGDAAINATTVTAGTKPATTGIILVTGAAPAATLTIGGMVVGGSNSDSVGVNNASTGAVIITGDSTAGSSADADGSRLTSAGTLTVQGSATGNAAVSGARGVSAKGASAGTVNISLDAVGGPTGSGSNSHGVHIENNSAVNVGRDGLGGSGANCCGLNVLGTGAVAITRHLVGGTGAGATGATCAGTSTKTLGGNMTDGSGGTAYAGKALTWSITAATYHQLASGVKLFASRPGCNTFGWQLAG